jgi:pimeloyl-ACP methyl ester carboxylesterase
MVAAEPHIPVDDLRRIRARTLVIAGDDDLVRLDHTNELFQAIDDAELAVVPGASHFVAMEKPELVNRIILSFLRDDPAATMMPIRRAGAPER